MRIVFSVAVSSLAVGALCRASRRAGHSVMKSIAITIALAMVAGSSLAQTAGWVPACEVLPWDRVTPQYPTGFVTKSYLRNYNSTSTTKRLTTRLITFDRLMKGADDEAVTPTTPWRFVRNEYKLCHRGIDGYELFLPPQVYRHVKPETPPPPPGDVLTDNDGGRLLAQ